MVADNVSEEGSPEVGLILSWTKTYFIMNKKKSHITCGDYKCNVTRDRSRLSQSDLVVF